MNDKASIIASHQDIRITLSMFPSLQLYLFTECLTGYWGPRCQYKDECDTDNDCGNGKCMDIGGTSLPRKQCYCSTGYHGEHCQLQNKDTLPTPENLQLSSHKKTVLSDRMTLYHRVSQ